MRWLRQGVGLVLGAISFLYLIFVLNPIQMLSMLLYPVSVPAARWVNRWCARSIWGLWVLMAERMHGTKIEIYGDAVPPRENSLVLTNHQSMADVLVTLSLAWRCGRLGHLKCFVKDIVKYFPGFGWGMKMLDFVYVKRDWAQDEAGIRQLFAKYREGKIPLFLISFLEGTRKTEPKFAAAQSFARERDLHVPKHTLVPRTKGFVATMHGLREHLDAVYIVTIVYPEGVPTLVNLFEGKVDRILVHIARYPTAALPEGDEALGQWAHARFKDIDDRLELHEQTGTLPDPQSIAPVSVGQFVRSEAGAPGLGI